MIDYFSLTVNCILPISYQFSVSYVMLSLSVKYYDVQNSNFNNICIYKTEINALSSNKLTEPNKRALHKFLRKIYRIYWA